MHTFLTFLHSTIIIIILSILYCISLILFVNIVLLLLFLFIFFVKVLCCHGKCIKMLCKCCYNFGFCLSGDSFFCHNIRAHQTRRIGRLFHLGFNEIAQFLSKSEVLVTLSVFSSPYFFRQ